jgi:hypothetical protein
MLAKFFNLIIGKIAAVLTWIRSIGAATPIPTTRVRVARRLMRRPQFLTFKAQKQNSFTSAQASRESSFGPLSHAIRVGGLWTVQNAFP